MVVRYRLFRRCCIFAILAALLSVLCLHRALVADTTTTSNTTTTTPNNKSSTPQKVPVKTTKKPTRNRKTAARRKTTTKTTTTTVTASATSVHGRAVVRPMKPVPLSPLEPVPIELGDGTALGIFFAALGTLAIPADAAAPSGDVPPPQMVRIIHFGDSHVASDYWAGVLREYFQQKFGDAGPGFVLPGRPWPTIRYADAKSLDGLGWRTDDLRFGENDGVLGLGGMSMESLHAANPASASAVFAGFDVFAAASPGSDCFRVQSDGAEVHDVTLHTDVVIPAAPLNATASRVPEPSSKALGGGAGDPPDPAPLALASPIAFLVPIQRSRTRRKPAAQPVPPFHPWPTDSPLDLVQISNSTALNFSPHRISVLSACGSTGRLLGTELYSGHSGVLYDTDGVNGARLSDLEKPLPGLRKLLLQQARPGLIIVSYGTNDIGTKGFSPESYEETAYQILSRLKADAGNASILVTGPTDRGAVTRRMRLFIQAAQAQLQPALRKAALRAGCAYWDQQAAMGGPGSMARWVRAGLAQGDYVHLTGLGYKKMADLLFAQLMAEYTKFQKTETTQ
jgi:lysophospholipase L1-like esterase